LISIEKEQVKKLTHAFLLKNDAFDYSTKKIKHDLCNFKKIDYTLFINVEQLMMMSVSTACEHVVKGQHTGYDMLFELIESYRDKLYSGDDLASPQELCDLIDLVDPKKKFYIQALEIKFQILLNQDQEHMTTEDKILTKQMLFDNAFKKGDIEFAQCILGELCGFQIGASAFNSTNLSGFIFELSSKIKELQQKE
jgi:hypothetical protein